MGHDGPYCWQMPQGGIDKGEAPEHAAVRELYEETGIPFDRLIPLGETTGWLCYDFPKGYKQRKGQNWRGQKQKWFAFRLIGKADCIDLKAHGIQEFSEWKWEALNALPDLIVPFKRSVYETLVTTFERYAKRAPSTKHSLS